MKDNTDEFAAGFINGLKTARDVYAKCPSCEFIFSLHGAVLIHGKSPPKSILAKSQKQVAQAQDERDNAKERLSDITYNLNNKIAAEKMEHAYTKNNAKETIRHYKKDIAAAQKEVIKEKVDKALISSRGVIESHIAELFPHFQKTNINPVDLCGLVPTRPLDFIVFNGLYNKNVKSITFMDVKKGQGRLTPVQQQVKNAIHDGHVDFKTIKVNFGKIKGSAVEST